MTFPDGASFVFPTLLHLPRTGGALIGSGTPLLTIGVGQRTSNTVNFTDQSDGLDAVEWNGLKPHPVMNVQSILVQAARSRHDRITISLGSSITYATAIGPDVTTSIGLAREASHSVIAPSSRRTSGTAIQTGTVLTISVTSPKIRDVSISSRNFGQTVQPAWMGSDLPAFTDVSTIIVDIRNGTKDFVALDNAVAKGP